MKNFEDKVVKIISKIICDRCDEQAIQDDSAFHEFISINHRRGYGSIHGDGNVCSNTFLIWRLLFSHNLWHELTGFISIPQLAFRRLRNECVRYY